MSSITPGDDATLRQILVTNPACLYDFPKGS